MKLLIIGTLLAIASTMKVGREHNTIFESCSGGCGEGRYCERGTRLWDHCADCCYHGDSTFNEICYKIINFLIIVNKKSNYTIRKSFLLGTLVRNVLKAKYGWISYFKHISLGSLSVFFEVWYFAWEHFN